MEPHNNLTKSADINTMIRPPICRSASAILDRALFSKTVPISAARITNMKNISRYIVSLEKSNEILRVEKITRVQPDPDPRLASKGGKCLLLIPEVKPEDPLTWSSILKEAVAEKEIVVVPCDLKLDYDHWTYYDIMSSILPEDAQGEIPVGFAIVGHVAHLNLRDEYLPYKKLIAQVLIDKNPTITTVINKIDDVGTESVFRTFSYEVLAGPDDMNVEISEGDCVFKFNYAKVYWNSRLQTEHKRLVDSFQQGEVVCDVMAGVGPFAIPAGKKGVFVWANDLNPDSYTAMVDAVKRNKVDNFVRPHCQDGHTFIKTTADVLLSLAAAGQNSISIPAKVGRRSRSDKTPIPIPIPEPTVLQIPDTISHFVMNLPASAISFLPAFRGLYAGHEALFTPSSGRQLPMVHVHCFSTKSDDNVKEGIEIAERVSRELGVEMVVEDVEGEMGREGRVVVREVRDVAPKKRMFCASFRVPREVAFAERV